MKKSVNKYDAAIRAFYLLFYAAGLVIFVAVGLAHMTAAAWLLAFVCAALGATAYGTIAKLIVGMVRSDRTESRADLLIKLFYVVFFSLATVAFLAAGIEYSGLKSWIIAFVAAYGAALVYSTIARLIVTLIRKDNQVKPRIKT